MTLLGMPSSNLSPHALSYLTLLLNVIDSKDWHAFREVALQNPKAFRALSNMLSSTDEFNGMSFLHAVVRNNPPIHVVVEFIRVCPDSPMACDCLNRTPLHVAAGVGADVEVIKYLAMAYPEACRIQDEDGRTPLHFACDVDCRLFAEDTKQRNPPTFELVYSLLSVSIVPASMEDEEETSPLEYAIMSNADLKVVKLLQKAAQKHMKNMHAREEQGKYERSLERYWGLVDSV